MAEIAAPKANDSSVAKPNEQQPQLAPEAPGPGNAQEYKSFFSKLVDSIGQGVAGGEGASMLNNGLSIDSAPTKTAGPQTETSLDKATGNTTVKTQQPVEGAYGNGSILNSQTTDKDNKVVSSYSVESVVNDKGEIKTSTTNNGQLTRVGVIGANGSSSETEWLPNNTMVQTERNGANITSIKTTGHDGTMVEKVPDGHGGFTELPPQKAATPQEQAQTQLQEQAQVHAQAANDGALSTIMTKAKNAATIGGLFVESAWEGARDAAGTVAGAAEAAGEWAYEHPKTALAIGAAVVAAGTAEVLTGGLATPFIVAGAAGLGTAAEVGGTAALAITGVRTAYDVASHNDIGTLWNQESHTQQEVEAAKQNFVNDTKDFAFTAALVGVGESVKIGVGLLKSASETGEVTANTATEMSHAPKEITPSPTPSPNPTPEVTSPTPTPNPTPEITSPTPTPNPTREITTPTPSQAPISEVNAPAAARYNTSSEGELQSRVTGFSNEAEARSFAEKVTGNYVPPSDAPGKLNVPSVVVRNERLTDPNVLERPSVPAAVPEVQPPTIGAPDVHGQQRWTFGNDGQAQEFARSFGGQYQEASQIPGEVNQPSVLMRTPDSFTDDFDQVHVRFSGQNGDTLAQEYARSTGGTFVEASTNPGEVNVPSVVLKRSNSVYSISTKLED